MKEVSEGLKFNPLDAGKTFRGFDNAAQFVKLWQEMAENGIKSEEDLNKLKLSNLTKLGLLTKAQQDAAIRAKMAAEKKFLNDQAELWKKSLAEELKAERAQKIAALGDLSEDEKKRKIAAIDAALNAEKQAREDQIKELVDYEFAEREKAAKKEAKEAKKRAEKEEREKASREAKEKRDENKEAFDNIFGKQGAHETLGDWITRIDRGMSDLFKEDTDENGNKIGGKKAGYAYIASNLTSALSNFAKQLEGQIDEIGSKKSAIDTRLQGSNNETRMGSYWDQMSADITGFAGVSPLIKQSAVTDRVATMVGQGIAFNVEQRATLNVLKDKIATTFDAANGTLLRLVKIQQQDTTAGRLGMESALTAFLNNMYETTEYMQGLAIQVKGSLEEAMSLMSGENALSFEYQIQKWLGSLSSVGMSEGAVQGLAGVLGQVAAGKLEGITGGGQGNLVIMAANQAGVSMSDILNNGLDQNTTNTLMNSMVDYLAKIYNDAGDSKVIQQQIASVYGLSASDLKAAVNLSKSTSAVAKDGLDYSSAMGRLYSMAGSMGSRTSLGEQLSNMWANTQYSMAAGIANNPITYGLYKMSGLLKDTTGGINFGVPLVMGNGMPITFNVADLMRTGALAGGVMSSLGSMIIGGGGGGLTGKSILNGIGLSSSGGPSLVTRGSGSSLSTMGGITVSDSGSMIGNSSSDDMTNKTMTDQNDTNKQETASAVDESDDTKLSDVDNHIITIIDILRNISEGNSILKVAVEGGIKVTEMPVGAGL